MVKPVRPIAALVFVVAISAAAATARQLQTKPSLGQIVRSSSATLGGIAVPGGGTLLSGDIMSTPAGGSALLQFAGGNQVELDENTIVTFTGTPDHVLATIDHGAVTVRMPSAAGVAVETLRCRIDSAGQAGSSYLVSAPAGSTAASIKALHGPVAVNETGKPGSHTVAEGETWTCPPVSAAQAREEEGPGAGEQAGQAPAPSVSKHSNTGLLVLLIGGGVAGGIAAALAGGGKGGGGGGPASPSVP
jgi:hypothetical protein